MDIDMCKQRGEVDSKHIPHALKRFFKAYKLDNHDSIDEANVALLDSNQNDMK